MVVGLAGLAPVLTNVEVEVVDEVAGVELVVGLPFEITFTEFAELVGVLLVARVNVLPPEPKVPPPALDANATTGAALLVGVVADTTVPVKLGAVIAGMTSELTLLAVVWEPIAVHGGPPGQPVITSWPLTKLRL